jgi:hypothetical protein
MGEVKGYEKEMRWRGMESSVRGGQRSGSRLHKRPGMWCCIKLSSSMINDLPDRSLQKIYISSKGKSVQALSGPPSIKPLLCYLLLYTEDKNWEQCIHTLKARRKMNKKYCAQGTLRHSFLVTNI